MMASEAGVNATGSRSFACSTGPPATAWRARERGVVRNAHRLHALREARQPVEVPGVEPRGRAERQAHAVQADRIDLARRVEHGERGTAVGEEVLGVDLDESERRPALEQLR